MTSLLKPLLLSLGLAAASVASAQINLNDFSAYVSPNTAFAGSWEATSDPFGTPNPNASFSQGVGVYNFDGGGDDDASWTEFYFNSPLNATGYDLLQISASLLASNTAPTVTVFLFDQTGGSAAAVVDLSLLGSTLATLNFALTDSALNFADIATVRISGNWPFTSGTVGLSIDNLALVQSSSFAPVPEPSTIGLVGAAALVGGVWLRRRRRA